MKMVSKQELINDIKMFFILTITLQENFISNMVNIPELLLKDILVLGIMC